MEIKLNQILVLGLLFLLLSCETRFETNTRVLVKGKVVDDFGQPISNAEISVYTQKGTGYILTPGPSGEDEYLLGRNICNADGTFSVTSIFDEDVDFFIEVVSDNNFSEYIYKTSTLFYTPENLVFDLQTVTLKELVNVNYNISRVSGEGNSISYTFTFIDDFCIEVFEEGELIENESYCFQDIELNGTLNDNLPNIERNFSSVLGSIVEFTYSINNQPEVSETFTIGQENYEFTFTY